MTKREPLATKTRGSDGVLMGFQDRYYYRDAQSSGSGPVHWLLNGSIPLFTLAGIRVRAHSWLVLFIAVTLLFGTDTYNFEHRVVSMSMLVLAVLLHEFGHAFMARWVGGSAEEILLTPLGGLALAQAPQRPGPTFLTAVAGILANLLTCGVCAGVLYAINHISVPGNPFSNLLAPSFEWASVSVYIWYLYVTSYLLILFNLLPILPLDGGQMLQAALWYKIGYGKALLHSASVGLVLAIIGGLYFMLTGQLFPALILLVICLPYCIQQRAQVNAAGVWSFEPEYDTGAATPHAQRRHHLSRLAKWRARRQIRQEELEQGKIDQILQKVHDQGMNSLSWLEKRTLRRATERQRQREMETSRHH